MPAARLFAKWGLRGAWLGAVVAGFSWLHSFEATAGTPAAAPTSWPASAQLPRDSERPTLLVFLHPRCPCSRATLQELNKLLAHCAGRVTTRLLVYSDPALGPDRVQSSLLSDAATIPGVTVLDDPLGATARLFGARTSGEACLYTRDGLLAFDGGITAARGQAGDSEGGAALQALILDDGGAGAVLRRTPVFGCGLLGPREAAP